MTTGPVTLINPIAVEAGREAAFLADWERVAAYMRRQPGFVSTRLHRAIRDGADFAADFAFVNVAEWASAEAYADAVSTPEFKAMARERPWRWPSHPALYRVVAD